MLTGVLLHRVQPCGPVDAALHGVAHSQRGIGGVGDGGTVGMHGQHTRCAQCTGVAGLAAALGEEGCVVQHDRKAALHRGTGQHLRGERLHIGICFV